MARKGTTVTARMIVPSALCASIQALVRGRTFFAKRADLLTALRHEAMAATRVEVCVCSVSHDDDSRQRDRNRQMRDESLDKQM